MLSFAAPSFADPFADSVVAFHPGPGAGYGQDRFPQVVLGPPEGGGESQGSLDVLSLGHGGEIVLGFLDEVICDGPGPDFTVFENPFRFGTGVFAELGIVAASRDGKDFRTFPFDPVSWEGLAGRTPVLSNTSNGIDPTDPRISGGDSFDLAAVGLEWAAFVRILDAGDLVEDPGNRLPGPGTAGFDLDAVVAIHSCPWPEAPTPTAYPTPPLGPSSTPTSSPRPTPTPTSPGAATASPTPTPSATPTPRLPTPTPVPASPTPEPARCCPSSAGDVDGDGFLESSDLELLLAEIFDGDEATAFCAGIFPVCTGADVNEDGSVDAADLVGFVHALGVG
ncbi:MAG: hypothetical protein KatS3mg076_2385 [Candidatus Binatia bacterium]|nr:MAG: hypothetical protein KatS3mg076_2385 [Candidatus Binatia bacterium]